MATNTILTVQQPQAPTYNHPCGDLFDEGKRREYLDIVVPLYKASMKGDLKAAKVILQDHEYVVRYSITEKMDTPLHVAAAGHSTKLVSYLVNMMSTVDLELQNSDGNTAFCIAAISGNVEMIKIMFMKNLALPTICGSENMTPLYLAAYHGNSDVATFLYDQSDRMMGKDWTDDKRNAVLLKCIQSNVFDVALRIVKDNKELPQDKHLWDGLQELAQKPEAFKLYGTDSKSFFLAPVYLVKTLVSNKRHATQLLRLLWKRTMEKPKDFIDEILKGPKTMVEKSPGHMMETYPFQILFIAAKSNNKRFLAEMIREYPDLIWKKNDDGQTIFHISVSHRHWQTFSLLYEIGSWKDLVGPITDQYGNNILHLAGEKPEKNDNEDRLTPTFRMDSEFLWYKEVEAILPPPCRQIKNAAGKTPRQLYIENHKEENSDGTKWIYDTVNLSMVVAALVCTISFSVVYSIPGGFNQINGYPMFLHNKYFIGFVELQVISFILSSSSIILFLSTILSRPHHGNIEFLIKTWVAAQLLLLMSIYFLVGAFCFSFFLIYRKTVWTYLLYLVALLVTGFCTTLCISLLAVTVGETYGRGGRRGLKNSILFRSSLILSKMIQK